MENLRNWWAHLAQREQQLVAVMAVLVAVSILYWGIWTPISNAEQRAELQRDAQANMLSYVKQTANKIAALKKSGSNARAVTSGSLSTIVTQSAGRFGLTITRMQPQGNKIQVWMDDVPFEALLSCLDDLVQQQGLSLDNLDVAVSDAPGMVQVRRIQFSQS
ncbi:general secretion pathway protein GspM [Shewanella mangrovi]|uniref:Type II secretion system protein M n=1 Tax=Shewanella mangrovi TaxID=1515746 RepID=A0A094JVY4_9GAMM|nr:type II secretion system protein M [Shewanella mangrovi]KFZ36611.1 general secretion pathway protein GspM [Shewanella mangrovi]